MKLVLSRKGFDSAAGGVPSPILPGGRLQSLPIPDPQSAQRYRDIGGSEPRVATLVAQLSPGLRATSHVHLDPDLDADQQPRLTGWRPAFGQAGAALGHLERLGVGVGDLFLFFGWFRAAERHRRRWRFVPGAPDLHLLFGWLQVGEVIDLRAAPPGAPWASHVHCTRRFNGGNALFVAAPRLVLDGTAIGCAGGGHWRHTAALRQLTVDGWSRSQWRLPRAFLPIETDAGLDCLSCHARAARWRDCGSHCELHAVPRGQEFVLDCARRPGVLAWAASLFDDVAR
ncbi:MAG: hypothetical protein AAGA11_08940 [Pseudomonadota bacterium]